MLPEGIQLGLAILSLGVDENNYFQTLLIWRNNSLDSLSRFHWFLDVLAKANYKLDIDH